MVLAVVAGLIGVAKVRYEHTFTDSFVFRLHYHWTTALCFIAGAIVTATDFVGSPIHCLVDSKNAPKPITTYCWISPTYTINSTDGTGIGQYHANYHKKTFYAYYQWVPAVLFLQGCLFYLPHFIWKSIEGKRLDLLLQDLNKNIFDTDAQRKKDNIIKYLKNSWGMNVKYSVGYFVCEAMNLGNVVGQMFLLDKFFGGFFMKYGTKVFSVVDADDMQRTDPMTEVFPRLTKCLFHMYGSSGTIQKKDALCVLPQNIINEKIFLVMWVWFIVLMIVTALQILCRMALFYSSFLRVRLISHRAKIPVHLELEQAVRDMHLGDYCLLDNIGRNLDTVNFVDILKGVTEIAKEVNPSAPPPGTYRPIYPSLNETLPRKRNLDQPDTPIQ